MHKSNKSIICSKKIRKDDLIVSKYYPRFTNLKKHHRQHVLSIVKYMNLKSNRNSPAVGIPDESNSFFPEPTYYHKFADHITILYIYNRYSSTNADGSVTRGLY